MGVILVACTACLGGASSAFAAGVSSFAITPGGSFHDHADVVSQLAGFVAPPSGTVTFNVYGPGDTVCTGPVVFTSTNQLSARDKVRAATDSDTFTPTAEGTYRVVASYSGNGIQDAAAGAYGDPAETVTVAKLGPSIRTAVSPAAIALGGAFTDRASVAFRAGGAAPTGTVTFNVYSPDDPPCTKRPVFTSTNPLTKSIAGIATADSDPFTPTGRTGPGNFDVVASYSGDQTYNAAAGKCGDPNESGDRHRRDRAPDRDHHPCRHVVYAESGAERELCVHGSGRSGRRLLPGPGPQRQPGRHLDTRLACLQRHRD